MLLDLLLVCVHVSSRCHRPGEVVFQAHLTLGLLLHGQALNAHRRAVQKPLGREDVVVYSFVAQRGGFSGQRPKAGEDLFAYPHYFFRYINIKLSVILCIPEHFNKFAYSGLRLLQRRNLLLGRQIF